MSRIRIPTEILSAAHDRAAARGNRDWPEADRLRALIENAGWKIVDRGTDFALESAHPLTQVQDDVVHYGSSDAVPSRLDGPTTGLATVVLVATDWPADLDRAVKAVRAHAPAVTVSTVIVADGPSAEQDRALPIDGDGLEVVRTSTRLGTAAAWNIGIRRASGPVVIVLDTSLEPTGDIITPLVTALTEPIVGVAGGFGIVSADLRRYEEGAAGDVTAVKALAMAFRRSDAAERGPLDERFRIDRHLEIWWSLVLRDEGEGFPARRALAVPIPAIRHEQRGGSSVTETERGRLSKRDFYRIIDRFGHRLDLASG